MYKYQFVSLFISLVFSSCLVFAKGDDVEFDQVTVKVNDQVYSLEYARSFEQRAQGLMYRKSLCKNCGMLFKYAQPITASMWMKNTFIPLDVAFIRADGKIVDIKPMFPHDLTAINSSEPVMYAWEMEQNWFARNKVKVGDRVTIAKSH